ncbi:mannose-1-phosphate guanylyltransferase [Rhodonellum psychrophilum GCM71 = DSM 17998]|uniref:mannose-1-phosphate guanylyltransferase n=2 Tax=Rhodonellum TaxID=336827 RepID=U5BWD1_9BACT|nr:MULTISPECIES: mannose-1-phosphate guanylyltransferase [Rhodonellum]ERM82193.1 mannose-1-phosphate guanylyltransferase [Rhodonellum psychrophilum GCM71 = DSM 17998]SDZ41095.1 mannose-1-phosphate guanylyltransferase (GDP) [Rhodonellum ikkaensis]
MNNKPYVVIMAGGIGSRFWPYSRNKRPKQFLDILGTGRTLLQMTYDRFLKISDKSQFYVVTYKKYYDLVREQLPDVPEHQILKEPLRRNTATCVAYASYKIALKSPDAKIIVTPSDQLILQEENFREKINSAVQAADTEDHLITIGIQPNRPETGFGYIQYLDNPNGLEKKVKTFTEKPNVKLAKAFVESGDFVWNSGMFVWKVKSILKAFEQYMPELAEVFEEREVFFNTPKEEEFLKKAYSQVKSISIDYGIMEKSNEVYVILGDFGWSDLGSWRSLYENQNKDSDNNVVEANALLYDTKDCYIKVSPQKLVVVQGLSNYLINETENVILICKLDAEKKFREFVSDAKEKGEDFV